MIPPGVAALFANMRPTIGRTHKLSVTSTASSKELFGPGLYLIQNMGPSIAYVRMDKEAYDAAGPLATTDDMPLFPFGSDDMSAITVEVGPQGIKTISGGSGYSKGHPADPRHLHYVTEASQVTELRVTRITKD